MDMSLSEIYKDGCFSIYHSCDGYILVNNLMNGFAHTHLNNKGVALYLIGLSKSKKIPRDISRYLLISLIRVNSDRDYLKKLDELLNNKKKKASYRNKTKFYGYK